MSGPATPQDGRRVRALTAAAVCVAIAALWLRFHAPPPLGPKRIGLVWHGDLLNYFVPMARQLALRLSRGELPLWNPDACSGIPLLATLQVGALHPGSWLAMLVHPIDAFAWRASIETALGAWGFAWFARSLGLGHAAAGAAAVWFVFACLLGQSYWPPLLSVTAAVPWLFLAVERFVQTGATRWALALALVTGFEWIAGFPQLALYAGQLVAAYAAVRLVSRARRAGRRETLARGAVLLAAATVGIGLASVQLLPTLELVGESARRGALDPAEVAALHGAGGADTTPPALDTVTPLGASVDLSRDQLLADAALAVDQDGEIDPGGAANLLAHLDRGLAGAQKTTVEISPLRSLAIGHRVGHGKWSLPPMNESPQVVFEDYTRRAGSLTTESRPPARSIAPRDRAC